MDKEYIDSLKIPKNCRYKKTIESKAWCLRISNSIFYHSGLSMILLIMNPRGNNQKEV